MTETQRKFLTEYLGECWHSITVVVIDGNPMDLHKSRENNGACGALRASVT